MVLCLCGGWCQRACGSRYAHSLRCDCTADHDTDICVPDGDTPPAMPQSPLLTARTQRSSAPADLPAAAAAYRDSVSESVAGTAGTAGAQPWTAEPQWGIPSEIPLPPRPAWAGSAPAMGPDQSVAARRPVSLEALSDASGTPAVSVPVPLVRRSIRGIDVMLTGWCGADRDGRMYPV
jgi:hypothetical protein